MNKCYSSSSSVYVTRESFPGYIKVMYDYLDGQKSILRSKMWNCDFYQILFEISVIHLLKFDYFGDSRSIGQFQSRNSLFLYLPKRNENKCNTSMGLRVPWPNIVLSNAFMS